MAPNRYKFAQMCLCQHSATIAHRPMSLLSAIMKFTFRRLQPAHVWEYLAKSARYCTAFAILRVEFHPRRAAACVGLSLFARVSCRREQINTSTRPGRYRRRNGGTIPAEPPDVLRLVISDRLSVFVCVTNNRSSPLGQTQKKTMPAGDAHQLKAHLQVVVSS